MRDYADNQVDREEWDLWELQTSCEHSWQEEQVPHPFMPGRLRIIEVCKVCGLERSEV